MSRYYRSFLEESGVAYTARTTAFATATAITDTTILNALNTFDLGLINNGLDTKMKALYPFVGNTATTQKYNFMDARDLDVAFRLQFNGGWSHSANGIQGNATNTFANTFFSNLNNNCSFWAYSRTNLLNTSQIDMGVFSGVSSSTSNNAIVMSFSDGQTYLYENIASGGQVQYTSTNTLGFFGANRTSSTLLNGWHNGVKKGTNTNTSGGGAIKPIYIGGYNGNGLLEYSSSKQYSFSSIGDGLTDGEASTFYTLVQNLQTSLSRQV